MGKSTCGGKSASTKPVVFDLPGYKVDTALQVFETNFQLHSTILRIHSRFFRTFLDSADKTPAPTNSTFQYEYDTVVDADGKTWGLETIQKVGANFPRLPSMQKRPCARLTFLD